MPKIKLVFPDLYPADAELLAKIEALYPDSGGVRIACAVELFFQKLAAEGTPVAYRKNYQEIADAIRTAIDKIQVI